MSTQTPKRDNLHGEPEAEAPFGSDIHPEGVSKDVPSAEELERIPTASQEGIDHHRSQHKNPNSDGSAIPRDELQARESNGPAQGASSSGLTTGGEGKPRKEKLSFGSRLKGYATRRNIAAVAAIAVIGGGGVGILGILQGPFQYVQLAQQISRHFSSINDSTNDRASKTLVYTLAGKGLEKTRLGIKGNAAANRFERKMINERGMRPVYVEPGRRFAGFEIVNETKAIAFLGDLQEQNGRNSRTLQRTIGGNAEITNGDSVKNGRGDNVTVVNSDGQKVDANTKVVNLLGLSFKERRAWIKTIGRAMSYYNIVGSLASRLLIKRGGVGFSTLEKLKERADNSAPARAERAKEFLDKRKEAIVNGVKKIDPRDRNLPDDDPDAPDPNEKVEVSGDTKNYVDDFLKSGVFKSTASAAIIVGVTCGVKTYGESISKFKYEQNVLPQTRIGVNAMVTGNQVMSNDNFDDEALAAMSTFLYDEEEGTSWASAESIRAENNQKGGVSIPDEALLKDATDKPKVFDVIDSIPVLGEVCDLQEGFFNLPVIKQVAGAFSKVQEQAINAALGVGGYSLDELMEASLKLIAGKAVDPDAEGADFGNFANTGAFLAANDNAIALGGDALTREERIALKEIENISEQERFGEKSFFARYFDPYEYNSVVGRAATSSLGTGNNVRAHIANPVKAISGMFSSLSNIFTANVFAQEVIVFDYGVPKYGFSIAELNDSRFEDPLENANVVENTLGLDRLNEEYGACFGIKIVPEGDSIKIENGETVNIFDLEENGGDGIGGCNKNGNQNNPEFLRYRMYILDTITTFGLACIEGDDSACNEIGVPTDNTVVNQPPGGTGSAQLPNGTEVELAQKLLDYKAQGKYNCDNPIDCEDLEFTVQQRSIKGGVGCVADKLDIRVLQMLVFLIDSGYEIGTYALCRSHSFNNGAHPKGMALDISSINGTPLTSTAARADTLAVNEIIFNLTNSLAPRQIITSNVGATRTVDPEFVKYNRIAEGVEGQPAVDGFGPGTMAGHSEHIHVGY